MSTVIKTSLAFAILAVCAEASVAQQQQLTPLQQQELMLLWRQNMLWWQVPGAINHSYSLAPTYGVVTAMTSSGLPYQGVTLRFYNEGPNYYQGQRLYNNTNQPIYWWKEMPLCEMGIHPIVKYGVILPTTPFAVSPTSANPYMYNPYVYTPYATGGYAYSPYVMGAYGTILNNPIANPEKRGNEFEARKMVVDQLASPASGANKQKTLLLPSKNLLNPPDDKILSGVALNNLLNAILDKDPKRSQGEGGFLPSDIMTRLELDGSSAADALGLLKTGKLEFPGILNSKPFVEIRDDLEKHASAVIEMMDSKKRDSYWIDKLNQSIGRARIATAQTMRDLPLPEAITLARFYVRLEQLGRTASDPSMQGVYVAKWNAIGVSVYDLTTHMRRYKLKFAPAEAGNENAYFALQRGLSSYYADLFAAKK